MKNIKMIPVESSNITKVGWDEETLYVEYNSGLYEYYGVPENIFYELLGSKSRGHYMNENIKSKYQYKKVKWIR